MLTTRYIVESVASRSGNKRVYTNKRSLDDFFLKFDQEYAAQLCQSHLKVLLSRKEQFVGTKTLNASLRFVATALSKAKMRKLCQQHI